MAELLGKLKEATAVPEHAARRVKKLDEMVGYLRKAKKQVDATVETDEARLRELDAEAAELERILTKIRTHKDTMVAERDDIVGRLKAGEAGFAGFIKETSATAVKTTRKQSEHRRKAVSEELRVTRGYSVDKDAKPHLETPESILAKARALSRRAPGIKPRR
jgi:TolA-binding protein